MRLRAPTIASVAALLLAGCTTADLEYYAAPAPGFEGVGVATAAATGGKRTAWIQSSQDAQRIAEEVRALVRGKTVGVETAVQVALLNNRDLQAAYAEMGISAAEVWQEGLPENPRISTGMLGIASPEFGLYRAIESMIALNLLSLSTREKRLAVADTRFRQAQARAIQETLKLAIDTRRAWIDVVGAFERIYFLNQAKTAADAASSLAERLGETGAIPKARQAREHAFYAELTGQTAEARLDAALAKERLARLMGLWGEDLEFFVPDQLPDLPRQLPPRNDVEARALEARVDLALARLVLEETAQSHGLTEATRYVTDLELIAGFEKEKEIETEYELDPAGTHLEKEEERKKVMTGQAEIEFAIPIFDTGEARLRKAEYSYMQAANRLAQKAVSIRSEAREAWKAWQGTWAIARHYRNAVVPLRTRIEEEALLTYNGMITSTFELLADTRARINTVLLSANARKEFWLADANLTAAIYGGGAAAADGGTAVAMAADDQAGH